MSVAKVMEISSESRESFSEAMRKGVKRADQTLDNVKSAWIEDQELLIDGGRISGYKVHMKVTFVLND
jgi:flavin-binding protein dodecin